VPKLRIALDAAYPGIIAEAMHAVTVLRGKAPGLAERPRHCVEVYSHWRHWLPQHGPGKKHTREIHLSEWQIALVDVWPHQLLRGLIHSDGCRFTNTGRRWSAPRYAFKQVSSDIRLIFCAACERLGVHWTEAPETIYVSRKADVALLDTFIGPKR
jgi:hypothetical protein